MKYLLIISCLLFTLVSCEEVEKKAKQEIYKGTLTGYLTCLDDNKKKAEVLSKFSVEKHCKLKHQVIIPEKLKELNGGYAARVYINYDNLDGAAMTDISNIVNTTSDYVITMVSFYMHINDQGKEYTLHTELEDLWVEPGQLVDDKLYTRNIKHNFHSRNEAYCSDLSKKGLEVINCKSWDLNKFYGIKIDIN
jgi:hypothetical protein